MIHHGTIRKYTAALLDLFNGIEVQYEDSTGTTVSKNIPIRYSTIEKSQVLDKYTTEQLLSGNYNVLPRGTLSLVVMSKVDSRITNKNVKINSVANENSFDYMYNSVPYEFTYQLDFKCRGMNEASQIIEQIAPKFNPTVNIDIWDAQNLDEPTRIPIKLLDISLESEEYEELSSNIVTIGCGISLIGNLYPPIKSIERIKDFKMLINRITAEENKNDDKQIYFNRMAIIDWDVEMNFPVGDGETTLVVDTAMLPPSIISIVGDNLSIGQNQISVIYDDKDNKITELTFDWVILEGNATITNDLDRATLIINESGTIEIQVTITDMYGNYASLSKIFTI